LQLGLFALLAHGHLVLHSGADTVEHTETEPRGVEENPILLSFLPFVIMAAPPVTHKLLSNFKLISTAS
jgi:hypothetical protein